MLNQDEIVTKFNQKKAFEIEFQEKQYFKNIKVVNTLDLLSKKTMAQAKLAGKVEVNINTSMSGDKRVAAYFCEDYAFHMHKKGFMDKHFKELDKKEVEINLKKIDDVVRVSRNSIFNSFKTLEKI